jgi:hypothetical protein
MKIYIPEHEAPSSVVAASFLDVEMLREVGHTIVFSRGRGAVTIALATADVVGVENHKLVGKDVILVSWDPSYRHCALVCYEDSGLFHSVFRLGYCNAGEGSFPITDDPIVFPYHPFADSLDRVRVDTTLRSRRVFFMGIAQYHDLPDAYGRRGMYAARTHLVRDLSNFGVNVFAEGLGFGSDSRQDGKVLDWSRAKADLCQKVRADFHLCCENSLADGYISEKIHHGFQSDLVVLYLGNSDIHKYVPAEAFINLNEYYDPVRRRVNVTAVADLIKSMTQEEYDRIIHAAREWRRTARLEERFKEQARRLTRMIIQRIVEVL